MEKTARAPRRGGPRIGDVAARAGVSVATVSRVLTGNTPVAPAKREQVLKAVAELGYRPSSIARSLSLGKTGVIGVVAPFLTYGATSVRLRGIMDRAAPEEYDVMVFNVESARQRDDAFTKFARRDRLDGLIVIGLPISGADIATLRAEQLPTVLVDVDHPDLSGVSIDNVAGGELATRHLLSKGHTRIAFVGDAPTSPLGYTSSDPRYQGYERALGEAGVALDPALVWRAPHSMLDPAQGRGPHSRVDAREAVARLLEAPAPPTAVFAASDMQAIGALQAAEQLDVRVPSELAVIGFDDTEIAEVAGLTTVRQPLENSGVQGMDILLAEMAEAAADSIHVPLPLEIVERHTT
jgi:LacI family transcriptional regulator/LacI family repressor for deo operon, udp, cdd, tsx, nupC, and nupG